MDAPGLSYTSASGRWVLAVSVLGSGIAALDATVVSIALPVIGRDFGTGVAPLQWVMNGYTLTLAAFLLIGGSLGDRFGRRKVYLIGTVWFALASAACGLAPDVTFLIITRVLQGVGVAVLTPGSLAILEASFRPADRARAIGAWSGLGGIAVAAGPLVGGYLISAASWRWIFFINVPIAVIVIVLSRRHVPESRDPDAGGTTDYLGAAAVVVFLSGITFAFTEAPALGWSSPAVLAMVLAGLTGLAIFLTWERHTASPMLPLAIFARRQFAAVNTVAFLVYGALTGATFLLPVTLQVVSGHSPLGSGLALLPLTIIMLAPFTATAMSSAPSDHAGIASAVNNDVARLGGLLAVAILPALAGITGAAYLHPAALAAGFRTAVLDAPPLTASKDRHILAIPPRG